MTSVSSQPPILPRTATSGTFSNIDLPGAWPATPAPGNANRQIAPQIEPVTSVREIRDADQSTTESSVNNDEERDKLDDDLAPPRPIGKHQPSWDPFNATPIAEEQLSSYDARPDQKSYPFPAATTHTHQNAQHPAVPGSTRDLIQSRSPDIDRSQLEHISPSDQRQIGQDGPSVSTNEIDSPNDLGSPTNTSNDHVGRAMLVQQESLDRSHSYSPEKQLSVARPADHGSHQKDSQTEVERAQQQDSTFLPPIRRTSAFGFKFGSRRAKERFAISDDEDDGPDPQDVKASGTDHVAGPPGRTSHESSREAHVPLRHERRSLQNLRQEDSGYSTDKPVLDAENKPSEPLYVPTRLLGSEEAAAARRQSLEEQERLQQTSSRRQSNDTVRPPLIQASSSEYSQRSTGSDMQNSINRSYDNVAPTGAVSRTSQDAWRPNVVATGVSSPPPQDIPAPGFAPRQSWDGQRPRGGSGSSYNLGARPEVPSSERQWSPAPARPFDQPPSAAQRYPNLFRSNIQNADPIDRDNADLPVHYYQQPLPREAAFLPRQQTNEYQLPGVGPDEYRRSPRRSSSLLRDIGGKISRATSRERKQSLSQDEEMRPRRSRKDSRVDDDADSSIISDEKAEKKKRRSSFFRSMNRSSTHTPEEPRRRDSAVNVSPTSARNSPAPVAGPAPFSGPTTNNATDTRIYSTNGSNGPNTEYKHKPNKLSKSSTSSTPEQTPIKKKRFSGLSGFFSSKPSSRNSTPDRPQPTRELSQSQRQPLESAPVSRTTTQIQGPPREYTSSPLQSQQGPPTQQPPNGPQENQLNGAKSANTFVTSSQQGSPARAPPAGTPIGREREQRSFSQPVQQEQKPRKASRTRRSSGAGLFSGLLGRKQSYQDDNLRNAGRDKNSQQAFMAPARRESSTPMSDQQRTPSQTRSPVNNLQNPPAVEQRARPANREPQYDSVPIPGGYDLVRAQAGQPAPTNYDPRGSCFYGQGPQYSQEYPTQSPIQDPSRAQQSYERYQPQDQGMPNLAIQTQNLSQGPSYIGSQQKFQSPARTPSRPLSPEDIVARSPALALVGQQRPYQLSLPDEDSNRAAPVNRTPTSPHSDQANQHFSNVLTQQAGPHSAVARLQPQIRHPESPSGYPLPDDTAFSPVVKEASDLPPPPPPKDMQRSGLAADHSRQVSGSSLLTSFDLNRSGTHRTAVSAVSGISDPPTQSPGGFSSNRRASLDRSSNNNIIGAAKSSTGPPSPLETSRVASPALVNQGNDIKTTVLEAPKRQSLDLYDASPLQPSHNVASPPIPPQSIHRRTSSRPETPKLSLQTPGSRPPSSSSRLQNHQQQTPRAQAQSQTQADRYAELEGTRADGFNMRIPTRRDHEEKIFYDAESGMRGGYGNGNGRDEEEMQASMSATSYPGQEWNPYGAGGWDDDSDVGVGGSMGVRR